MVVWIIYTGDRLLDTRKQDNSPKTARHQFHRKNSKYLLTTLILLALVVLFILPLLPLITVAYGVGLLLMVVGYFTFLVLLKSDTLLKEPIIAILYTCGVALPALSLAIPDGRMIFILAQHSIFAFLNLMLISYYEVDVDTASGHDSLASKLGKKRTVALMNYTLWLLLLTMVVYLILFPGMFSLFIQATFLSIWMIFYFIKTSTGYFSQYERYRAWADLSFWIPGWILLL